MITLYDKDGNAHQFTESVKNEMLLTGAYTETKGNINALPGKIEGIETKKDNEKKKK